MPVNAEFKMGYRAYKTLMGQKSKVFTEELGSKVLIVPTAKKVIKKVGIKEEAANCVNTAEYLTEVYKMMKAKGYKIPKIHIDEYNLPREQNLSGYQMHNWNVYGPGRLEVSSPSLVIHENGHFLHNKNHPYNQGLYAMFNDFRSLFRPFLNKVEKKAIVADMNRAYQEGYFRHLELSNCIKKGYIDQKAVDAMLKEPGKILSKNALSNVNEFIGDYFMLAVQGFKFSPAVEKRYKAFHGPEIKELFTKDEIDKLVAFRKKLEQRLQVEV